MSGAPWGSLPGQTNGTNPDPTWFEFQQWKAMQAAGNAALGFAPPAPAGPLRLDLGCGNTTRRATTQLTKANGWTGVDLPGTPGVDVECDLTGPWPFADSSVDEVSCAHMLEHVPARQRIHFFNELYRVLKPGAKAQIVTPHWASMRAYGDITHEWPPVSEMFWLYLGKAWREVNAPHLGFTCDFPAIPYGYITANWLQGRNEEYVRNACQQWKEAAQDMVATLVKPQAGP